MKDMKILGIEITIHKEPIKYDPMRHFREIIDERLDKIETKCVYCNNDK